MFIFKPKDVSENNYKKYDGWNELKGKTIRDDKRLSVEVTSFNMEIFIKAQFSIVQMSS